MDKDEIKTDIENKEDKDKSFYKKRIFDIIQIGKRGDLPSRSFDIFIVIFESINLYHCKISWINYIHLI